MADDRLHLFGIRHHGPGSASSLERALHALDPAVVLIEGPPEANEILVHAAAPGMRPPVAILVHAAEDASRASFFPFADYSPEWRAILWAAARGRPARFIDLPAAHGLAVEESEDRVAEIADEPQSDAPVALNDPELAAPELDDSALDAPAYGDPLGLLAQSAGHSDGEAWWNELIEQNPQTPAVFAAIEEAMTALRDDGNALYPADDERQRREDRREAHMRLEIAKALAETDGTVAVAAGAWHVPALRRGAPKAEDRALLKDLPKVKAVATWVPWTDGRLAASSGYGAGVLSPGWYRHLWTEFLRWNGTDGTPDMRVDATGATARWLTRVADLLRREGQIAATASVIETARLAQALAALRGYAVPGLAEMRDAGLAALCHGEPAPMRLIEERLIIGETVGEIDEGVPQMPLAADLACWQKRLRLKPEELPQEISLDLRSDAGSAKSVLLHRLLLIDAPWGRLNNAGGSRGTFRERWTLSWTPELSVNLAEALVWGATVEQAASNRATTVVGETNDVGEIAELVERCLLADLGWAAERCIARLQEAAVNASDIRGLMDAAAPLANVLRYGTARKMPEDALRRLVSGLTAEICVGMAHGCRQLDAGAAAALRDSMARFDGAIRLLDDDDLAAGWRRALSGVANDAGAAALIAGYAVRLLYDLGVLDGEAAAPYLSRALSPGTPPAEAGAWLEGFLAEAGQLLLHDPLLLALIDAWITELDGDDFIALLPALRRAFSNIDAMERRRLLRAAREAPQSGGKRTAETGTNDATDERAFARALPLLKTILGLEDAA